MRNLLAHYFVSMKFNLFLFIKKNDFHTIKLKNLKDSLMQTLMVRNLEPIIKIEHNSKKKSVDDYLNEKKVIE
jgi:hypothetical protein